MKKFKINFFTFLALLLITELMFSSSLSYKVYEIIDTANRAKFNEGAHTILSELELGISKCASGLKSIEGVFAFHNNYISQKKYN